MGGAGGAAVGQALASGGPTQLRQLFLEENALGEVGGTAVAEALSSAHAVPELTVLKLEHNALGQSAVALADAMRERGLVFES